MSRESLVFLLGFLVFVAPFVGLPRSVKDVALFGMGGLLMLIGFMLRRSAYLRSIERESGERQSDAFAESVAEPDQREVLPAQKVTETV